MSLERQLEYNSASMGKRFLTCLIDLIFYYIIVFIFGFLFAVITSVFFTETYFKFANNDKILMNLIAYSLLFFYYLFSEYLTGKTLGKLITGTKIVDIEGNKPSFKMSLIRTLCRFIPFDGLSFLFGQGRGWHDTIAKSYVIDSKYIV